MKVAVVGSRGLRLDIARFMPPSTSLVISGGAKGIDRAAERFADERGIEKLIILPEYAKYGRPAPIVRNKLIVRAADLVVVFWDGKSPGTLFSVEFAREIGKIVHLHKILKI